MLFMSNMKYRLTFCLTGALILLAVSSLLILIPGNDDDMRGKHNSIQIGMSRENLISLVGMPDSYYVGNFDLPWQIQIRPDLTLNEVYFITFMI